VKLNGLNVHGRAQTSQMIVHRKAKCKAKSGGRKAGAEFKKHAFRLACTQQAKQAGEVLPPRILHPQLVSIFWGV